MDATIHYLNWDLEDGHGPASELFHKATVEETLSEDQKPGKHYSEDEFDSLYREVQTVELPDYLDRDMALEELWRQWNRGSGSESRDFLELRYCEKCEDYIDDIGKARMHAEQSHGYSTEELSDPDYVRGARSMSVGDVVELDGKNFQVKSFGWDEISVER